MRILPVNNVQYRSKANLNASSNKPMTNTMNIQNVDNSSKVSFSGVFSTMYANSCMNTAKDFFHLGNNIDGVKFVTNGMKSVFSHANSFIDTMVSIFSKKQSVLLATASAALSKIDDKSEQNQELKKDFMNTMFLQDTRNTKNIVESSVVDAFLNMDNKVYGDYKNSLLKTASGKGLYYDSMVFDKVLTGVDMSNEEKIELKALNTYRLNRAEEEYQENYEPFIPQDPRYTP
ncbi:MAG: hypothetical protein MJ229_05170 [bacterium]|nr:hypothetical protein [bacterium]